MSERSKHIITEIIKALQDKRPDVAVAIMDKELEQAYNEGKIRGKADTYDFLAKQGYKV